MTDPSHTEETNSITPETHCGFVAIVGRPNVGKSTLLNQILGQKLCITSKKPQTTRHRILGIKTQDNKQAIYVDTPGMHRQEKTALNRSMNKAATSALQGVDVVIFLVDRTAWTDGEEMVLEKLTHISQPILLCVNKVDLLTDKSQLMPFIEKISQKRDFAEVIPISATNAHNLDQLESIVSRLLPPGEHHFPDDQITDRSSRFVAAEIVREKLMRNLGDEVPYGLTVEIEDFYYDVDGLLMISALILVERESQKKIVIGPKGAGLKRMGSDARKDLETMFDTQVMLNLWVKVKRGWSDDDRALSSLGYDS